MNEEMERRQTKEQYAEMKAYQVPSTHVTLETQIGTGASASIWKGYCRGKTVAVKILSSQKADEKTASTFRKECNLMATLQKNGISHENIIQMLFLCWDGELLMMLEFCHLGSLEDIMLTVFEGTSSHMDAFVWRNDDGTDGVLASIVHGVAKGLLYCHSLDPKVIHRDIKPGNIMIQGAVDATPSEWIPKVADFGDSRELRDGDNLSMVGTPLYCCPEIIMYEEYNEKCDVYSFGLFMYDLIAIYTGGVKNAKWNGKRYSQVNVVKGFRPSIPKDTDAWLKQLVKACWHGSADERPSFGEICSSIQLNLSLASSDEPSIDIKKRRTSVLERPRHFEGDAFKKTQSFNSEKRASTIIAAAQMTSQSFQMVNKKGTKSFKLGTVSEANSSIQGFKNKSTFGSQGTTSSSVALHNHRTTPPSLVTQVSELKVPKLAVENRRGSSVSGLSILREHNRRESIMTSSTAEPRAKTHIIKTKTLVRTILLFSLLGYSTILSLIIIIILAIWSSTVVLMTTESAGYDIGFPVADILGNSFNLALPIFISYGLLTVGNVGQTPVKYMHECGPKMSLATLLVGVILASLFTGLRYTIIQAGFNPRYTLLDIFYFFFFFCSNIHIF